MCLSYLPSANSCNIHKTILQMGLLYEVVLSPMKTDIDLKNLKNVLYLKYKFKNVIHWYII